VNLKNYKRLLLDRMNRIETLFVQAPGEPEQPPFPCRNGRRFPSLEIGFGLSSGKAKKSRISCKSCQTVLIISGIEL
jgi:hypothetical protein